MINYILKAYRHTFDYYNFMENPIEGFLTGLGFVSILLLLLVSYIEWTIPSWTGFRVASLCLLLALLPLLTYPFKKGD